MFTTASVTCPTLGTAEVLFHQLPQNTRISRTCGMTGPPWSLNDGVAPPAVSGTAWPSGTRGLSGNVTTPDPPANCGSRGPVSSVLVGIGFPLFLGGGSRLP